MDPHLVQLLMRWNASSKQDELVLFYQKLEENDRNAHHVLVVCENGKDYLSIKKNDVLADGKHETKLCRFLEEKKIPILFRWISQESTKNLHEMEKDECHECLVGIVNQVFKATPEVERKKQMQDMLQFVSKHEEIPLDISLHMLQAAAQGQSKDVWKSLLEQNKE